MNCPRCGHKMNLDGHRKIDMYMCYDCGYIEGRNLDPLPICGSTNFERLRGLNLNETVAFLAKGLNVDEHSLASWMESSVA